MTDMTATLRILEPHPGVFAYYDGRVEGRRLYSAGPNWLDDGAYGLGIASYAIVDAAEALVYDTHISLAHAQAVRRHIEGLGAKSIRVALSHWHDDHIAGNAVFADCEIIALKLTADALDAHREQLATSTPPISPLVMPNRLFETRLNLRVGNRRVELHHFDIHSADGNVLWLRDDGILLAGDTLEDTVTYISEAQNTATHIRELARLATWPIERILPNHGAPDRIAAGGYDTRFIAANRRYLERLTDEARQGEAAALAPLRDFIAPELATGAVSYFEPYEAVHRKNIAALSAI
ncbi:beta-lactamase [Sinorhizobium fredii USDA 205]|uniref:MBL fold metallo-hydrolase n=1 Tax=Rhizobium fredii TaxID=380 RepID=A0A844AB46_RHIFR|nr:MBL fold metallo-hydrolase [Sinorhizobium fredii]AWM29588.1 beta-lactamase domain protein [Sinorhizobium fredii CCBAU 25509]KSV88648.1 beta-lactamase [Sinorhizobium fredii USDA 205]MCG5473665.1 MBL fold metallo-hydrolase [Sinorhizobium fredii]MQW98135.1 MBL fold metallo-hydrolase [Sinorhizobium fredii]MQX08866.1 MBL fold metallo-hydrolase [Sinorhizobium fredii]